MGRWLGIYGSVLFMYYIILTDHAVQLAVHDLIENDLFFSYFFWIR